VAVDLKPLKALKNTVSLATMKQTAGLENLALIKQGRLSVCPVTPMEYKIILDLAK
jgi:predicted RNA-binding protein with PUA-like domain